MTDAFTTTNLTKHYGSRTVVDSADIVVPAGAVAGFIGPNGAGKTTTMAMLLGLVRPTSGTATVLGESVRHPERYLPRIGALLEGPALWPGLSAEANLRVLAELGGHDPRRIPEVLDLAGLADRRRDRFGRFSLGMKQRLGIAGALLGDPELLVLDEPTNGLDPAGMRDMRTLIARVAAEDRTVFISSHLLTELEHVCDWLIIIDGGRIQFCGPAADFAGTQRPTILLGTVDAADLLALTDLVAGEGLEAGRLADRLVVEVDDRDPRQLAAALNKAAAAAGLVLAELHVDRPTIESAYLRMLTEEAA
jgi:ABC-2 type transport system ATP-binding protein